MSKAVLCIFIKLAFFHFAICSEIIYVSQTEGQNLPCGTQDSPCVSLRNALDLIQGEASIEIAEGIYNGPENTNLILPPHNLTIYSPTKATVIDCSFYATSFGMQGFNNLHLEGITFANCSTGILFTPNTSSQRISLTSVLINNCQTGLISQGGNVKVFQSKVQNVPVHSSDSLSGTAFFIEDSDVLTEMIDISHSYFEEIPRYSIFINTKQSEQIAITHSSFVESSGIYANGGSFCRGQIYDVVVVGVVNTPSVRYGLEIEGGTWFLENITMTQTLKGKLLAGFHLLHTEATLRAVQLNIGDSGLLFSSSNVILSDSSIQSEENGIIIEYADNNVFSTSIHQVSVTSSSSSVSVLAQGDNTQPRHVFNMESCSFSHTGGLSFQGNMEGQLESCSFTNILSEHAITIMGGDWLFDDVSVSDCGGVYFDDAEVVIQDSSFVNNQGVNGGAIYFHGGKLQLTNCVFKNNQAEKLGGAVYVANSTMCVIENSVFESNVANDGAVVYCGANRNTTVNIDGQTLLDGNRNREGVDIPCKVGGTSSVPSSWIYYFLGVSLLLCIISAFASCAVIYLILFLLTK